MLENNLTQLQNKKPEQTKRPVTPELPPPKKSEKIKKPSPKVITSIKID